MEMRKVYSELEKYKSETASLETEVIFFCIYKQRRNNVKKLKVYWGSNLFSSKVLFIFNWTNLNFNNFKLDREVRNHRILKY